jgi:hypothetical protein
MPSAKSGSPGSIVAPQAPTAPHDADQADPVEVAKAKSRELKDAKSKYGQQKVQAEKKAAEESKQKGLVWIEIELVGEDDKPIAGERYLIKDPEGIEHEGTLDDKGFARVDGLEKGTCKVSFPNLDGEAWEKI